MIIKFDLTEKDLKVLIKALKAYKSKSKMIVEDLLNLINGQVENHKELKILRKYIHPNLLLKICATLFLSKYGMISKALFLNPLAGTATFWSKYSLANTHVVKMKKTA